MVREIVVVQVGQCGNQIGRRFWMEMLHEAATQPEHGYDAPMSALFRNVDVRYDPVTELDVGSLLSSVRARAILVDTEEGVIAETMRDPILGDIFEDTQLITDSSGAGNNWAQGYFLYGQSVSDVEEAARKALEACDSPQAFLFLHSVGGGTGSGLGSSVLELMRDVFPDLCRFNVAVYPSGDDDDVITSPYNAVLSTHWLTAASDCVVPVENKALLRICSRQVCKGKRELGFNAMNDVIAQLLSHLTAGARYPGRLNLDVNEIATNLVPFPRLHYLTASFSPVLSREWENPGISDIVTVQPSACPAKHVRRLCSEASMPSSRLIVSNSIEGPFHQSLATAWFARGGALSTDMIDASGRIRPALRLSSWNPDGLKLSVCAVPPLKSPNAVLRLDNSCSIVCSFGRLRARFYKLYRAKAMLHHYTDFMELDLFEDAVCELESVIKDYERAAK